MSRIAVAGTTLLCMLVLAIVTGCAKKQKPGAFFRPTYVPKYDQAGETKMAKEVTVKFIGTVMDVKPVGKGKLTGVVIGSKFHAKYAIDIRVDTVTQDSVALVTEGSVSTFYVEDLARVFGRATPKKDAPEKDRKYRFTTKGELEERQYEYKYFVGGKE